ncbi:MAG: PTS sugar transporter subunit IIA [Kiritimatiellae bacterium]|jgi:PTS system nitrogen regulatory IIA component|nr:PTS sugar transporter subunit IIA [Kiritimatiellia bacterium]
MRIINYTTRETSWLPKLSCKTREEVFHVMLEKLCPDELYETNPKLSHEMILETLIEREKQNTTVVGKGIAFPHARLEHLSQATFAVATLAKPVMFEEFPVEIVCLILVPISDPTTSLKIMAQLSRLLMKTGVREKVMSMETPNGLRDVFAHHNPQIDKPIIARDIMRPPRHYVKKETSVPTCSHMMSVSHLQAVPVLDDHRKVIGQITVEGLFRYGLPEFFSNLKSVSFIAEFDPFEKYFSDERNITVGDMMENNARTVPKDYTIMEIVFDLAIKSYIKLYVVDDNGCWIGTIDKSLVLDNVINY